MTAPYSLDAWRPKVVDWYFRLNFLAVAAIGTICYFARIPNHPIIPFVVAAYALVLLPYHQPRFLLAHAVLFLFPVTVWFNAYGYVLALQCWLPVLLNLFFVYLGKPNLPVFWGLAGFHACVLLGIYFGHPHANSILDFLGMVTNFFAALLLILIQLLMAANARLVERQKAFGLGLKRVVDSVMHDMSRWTAMSHLGLMLSGNKAGQLHEFIRLGIAGADELATRIKSIVRVDEFAFLKSHPLGLLLADVQSAAKAILAMELRCPDGLRPARVLIDKGILENALLNLVQNAAKAGARKCALAVSEADGAIRLELADDGPGLPAAILDALLLHPVPSGNGGNGSGLLNAKFNLTFMGAGISIVDPNAGGGGLTRIAITGIRRSEGPRDHA